MALDRKMRTAERREGPMWSALHSSRWAAAAAVLAVVGLAAPALAQSGETVTVGSKKFTESVVLGEISVGLVESKGFEGSHREQLGGTRVLWKALERGDIDVYPEYTGTIRKEIFPDRAIGTREALEEALRDEGMAISEPLGFENTYALGMKKKRAERLGIETISDLRDHPDLVFGFSNEFMDREDGWPGLSEHYGLTDQSVRALDHDLAYRGLESGDIDVVVLYSTDAEIEYYDLRVLEDDRDFFPDYSAVFLYREELAESAPGAVDALEQLEGEIRTRAMSSMNKAVKVEGRSEQAVAAEFLDRRFGIRTEVDRTGMIERVGQRTLEHLFMVAVSMAAAILLAIPLGIWAAKDPRFGQGVLGAVGILQTVPSLALLVLMIPFFGIGNWPAIAALFVYSLLPIVRNTYAGIDSISSDVMESARALGLDTWAILRLVELPMAMRSILAGIKTSVVINIGVATLGALVGAGGYGQPILTGIRLDDMSLIFEGAVPAAGMAIVAQMVFEAVERLIVPRGLRREAT